MMPAGAAAAVGGVAGLTWAAGFREYMASLVGKESKVTWYGTFGTILLPAVAIGALFGWAEHRRANGEDLPLRRTIAAAPIAIGVLPLTRPGAVATLRKTGEGSAASGVAHSRRRTHGGARSGVGAHTRARSIRAVPRTSAYRAAIGLTRLGRIPVDQT
jgi:hypothetical protein